MQRDAWLCAQLAEFVAAGGWEAVGASSLGAWLRDPVGFSRRDASRMVADMKRLRALPATRDAWANGELTSGQVDAIVANLRPGTVAVFGDHEHELVPALADLTVAETVRAMRTWAAYAEADGTEPSGPQCNVSISETLDGRYVLDGDLDAHAGSVVA